MANLKLQQEKLFDIFPEIHELITEHYNELSVTGPEFSRLPDWDEYKRLEEANQFVMFTVRTDNKLVGYSWFFLKPHMHYKHMILATNDIVYLQKDFREGFAGIKLIKYSDSRLKELGAHKITWRIRRTNDISAIFYRMGYSDEDLIVGKMLTTSK